MTKLLTGKVFQLMEEWAPTNKAYDWDNVGLQIGSTNQDVKRIMVTLDVLESVVDEAIEKKVDIIIAHHPLLFKPLKRINTLTPEGRTISKLIRHNITVYAAHTNLDLVTDGVNDMLANQLELNQLKPLLINGHEKLYKFAVHVPESHRKQLKQVLGDAGAGRQGDYSHCSFEIQGTGSFKPLEDAAPYIGEVGEIANVDEVKLEALVEEAQLKEVLEAVKKAHPYEEPAYDLIELANEGGYFGLGRIGQLTEKQSLQTYVQTVKDKLNVTSVRVVGDLQKAVKHVAVLGGSGEKYIQAAKRSGADVYITGDIGFHQAQVAMELGLAVIDAGHYIEQIMKKHVQDYLLQKLAAYDDVEVMISQVNTDPFQYL